MQKIQIFESKMDLLLLLLFVKYTGLVEIVKVLQISDKGI